MLGSAASVPAALSLPALPAPRSHAQRRGHRLEPGCFSWLPPLSTSRRSKHDPRGSPRDTVCGARLLLLKPVTFLAPVYGVETGKRSRSLGCAVHPGTLPNSLRQKGWKDGNGLWGWCLCSPGSTLPGQTQLLALLRNAANALFLLLLALRCPSRPPATQPTAPSTPAWAEDQALPQ